MAQKIKYLFIKMVFRLFSFLADKTNGWKIFVQPKLVLGTMILSFGVAACNSSGKKAQTTDCYVIIDEPDTISTEVIDTIANDTSKKIVAPIDIMVSCYEEVVMCYDYDVTPPDTIINPDSVYSFVPKKAEFPGGDRELRKWLQENINYPIIAVENGIQGKVLVNFVVRTNGQIDGVKVLRGVHPTLDNEAIRLVRAMPRWKAGEKAGVKVNSYFTLPVTFKIKEEKYNDD